MSIDRDNCTCKKKKRGVWMDFYFKLCLLDIFSSRIVWFLRWINGFLP